MFVEKNGSVIITLSASNLQEAEDELERIVYRPENFRCDDEEDDEEQEDWDNNGVFIRDKER